MKIYMIRHGKADYSYGDSHNFIGHGHDLAKLDDNYIDDVIKTAKDKRLKRSIFNCVFTLYKSVTNGIYYF